MEASNISSEPFLKEEEEVQSQVEVTSSVGGELAHDSCSTRSFSALQPLVTPLRDTWEISTPITDPSLTHTVCDLKHLDFLTSMMSLWIHPFDVYCR